MSMTDGQDRHDDARDRTEDETPREEKKKEKEKDTGESVQRWEDGTAMPYWVAPDDSPEEDPAG